MPINMAATHQFLFSVNGFRSVFTGSFVCDKGELLLSCARFLIYFT